MIEPKLEAPFPKRRRRRRRQSETSETQSHVSFRWTNTTAATTTTTQGSTTLLGRTILLVCLVWSNNVFVQPFFLPGATRSSFVAKKTTTTTTTTRRNGLKSFRRSSLILQQSSPSQSHSSPQQQSSAAAAAVAASSSLSPHQSTLPLTPSVSSSPPTRTQQSPTAAAATAAAAATQKLDFTKSFRSILARNRNHQHRQRFVTGQYPVIVTVEENPTRKWLDLGRMQQQQQHQTAQQQRGSSNGNEQFSNSVVLVNGTNIDRSLASYDRYQWLDDPERQELHDRYATVSMELLAEISIDKPGYLQIMPSDGAGSSAAHSRLLKQQRIDGGHKPLWNRWRKNNNNDGTTIETKEEVAASTPLRDRLWSTGFSLTSPRGVIKCVDVHDGHIDTVNPRSESMISWPNEISRVPTRMIKQQQQQQQDQPTNHQQSPTNHRSPTIASHTISSLHDSTSSSTSTSTVTSNFDYRSFTQDALLVADGFLVPGKDRGGIYVVNNPAHEESEWSIPLTDPFSTDRWFYHKSIWVDLTGDGRQSILTARAKLRKDAASTATSGSGGTTTDAPSSNNNKKSTIYRNAMMGETEIEENRPKNGQLIWLEMPKPHRFDLETGTPLEKDGTTFDPFDARHLPWKERVLATGPDVTFAVADMDPSDDTIEILASQFFDEKVTLHSIRRGEVPEVTFSRVIDDQPGAAFGGILVDLDPAAVVPTPSAAASSSSWHRPRVVDSGSTIKSLTEGNSFSHFLVTSHEFNLKNNNIQSNEISNNMVMNTDYKTVNGNNHKKQPPPSKVRGGSLLSYKVPKGSPDAWKTEPWIRTTIASGFQVKQQIWNVINPGAPGFAYAFHAHKDDEAQGKRPMIAVAGDCAESAYIFRPQQQSSPRERDGAVGDNSTNKSHDPQAEYKLMCEIKCGATVGSIAVGYDDLCSAEQEPGYAKIYIPCFEKDKILVFALGSGEEEDEDFVDLNFDDGGW